MNQHTKRDIVLIVIVIIYQVIMINIALFWLFSDLFSPLKEWFLGSPKLNPDKYALFSFFFAGILGGTFYCMRGIYERLADAYTAQVDIDPSKRKNPRDVFNIEVWLFWYIYRPLQSGILALVIICLFDQGIFNIETFNTENLSEISFQLGIGFLIGFGAHDVIGKMEEIIKVLFARNSTLKPNKTQNADERTNESKNQNN